MIRACIFDLCGTIVDKYSLIPFLSLKSTFQMKNIDINNKLIFKEMGSHKLDHIKYILNDPYVSRQWFNKYGRGHSITDVEYLFYDFHKNQEKNYNLYMNIIPETKNAIKIVQNSGIKCGITTELEFSTMDLIRNQLEESDIYLNSYVSSTCLNNVIRPIASMIIENMERLNISNPRDIIKIDDTCIGIKEGKNANCWTIGVSRWSINMGIKSFDEILELDKRTIIQKNKESRKILLQSGADFVIDTLDELPNIIDIINGRKILYRGI